MDGDQGSLGVFRGPISIYLGRRRGYGTERLAYKPHNTPYVVLGTVFLWYGWFGFNGGSALAANLRAVQACIVTNLAASVGGITWMLWDYRLEKKWSAVGFCSGAIAGLVAITPGSGYVGSRELFAVHHLELPLQQLLPFCSASWLAPCATLLRNSNTCLSGPLNGMYESSPLPSALCPLLYLSLLPVIMPK